jgi:N4-gp56 family major capsid protein
MGGIIMPAVSTTNGTYLANLFNPQVVGDRINKKLFDYIRFAPLARVYNNLEGRPGSTVTLPYYNSIGAATLVGEGQDIPISQLTESTVSVTISKYAKGVQITDEAVLSAYGDPIGEAVDQIAQSIGQAYDNAMLAAMGTSAAANMTTAAAALTADGIASALTLFGEDIDGDKVILVSPAGYETIRKANGWIPGTEVAANLIIRGTVGMIHGCQVVVSNKLIAANASYIVKPGALAIYNKRDILVETDRDIINKSTVITADRHAAVYVLDKSKLIKMPGQASTT